MRSVPANPFVCYKLWPKSGTIVPENGENERTQTG